MRWLRRGSAERNPDPAASMALLEEVLDPPVGPGYHSAARAREEAGLPASSGFGTALMFVVSVVLGLLVTVSAVTLRAPDPASAATRTGLIERIEAAQVAGDEQARRVEELRSEILALEQQQAAAESGSEGERSIAASALRAGAQPVQGPGVVVTLQDAESPAGEAPGEDTQPERVNARDLQLVVNGLWAAGAEAIAVNDHRLTSTSAIRFAGEAIIVDFRGLAPPYVVAAIGDPERLEGETSVGITGAYLSELRRQLGLRTSVTTEQTITLPAAQRLTTRVGQVPDDPTSTQENR
ncbi:DUF881 domain-containing protein [Ornithinimicrobium cerasi]|uniref:Uncharacterized conserved protein YlxW, UPF0749 family n=1 Tax=Ornithinimicrobium cerasi TaxID=2248773 RepID=A0A285VK29_9MICO|nr:DUF881 domain-containing protein [Ornithinimicrobium cerasi]SOC54333.1 Uncharacterized conserved protein YlxW, UPF0749 family [Ornithinimicrobium cerasi]